MTMWSGSFPPLNWHHHPQQGGQLRERRTGTRAFWGHPSRRNIRTSRLGSQVDELPPLPDEGSTGLLRSSTNTARRSQVVKAESLDAMNRGHPEGRMHQPGLESIGRRGPAGTRWPSRLRTAVRALNLAQRRPPKEPFGRPARHIAGGHHAFVR